MIALSIPKLEDGIVNEDAVKATQKWISVSDGAGGGGVCLLTNGRSIWWNICLMSQSQIMLHLTNG